MKVVNVEEMPREDRTSPKLQEFVPTELPFKNSFSFLFGDCDQSPVQTQHDENKQDS
ncbi:MAG: hypothetical protein ABIU20_03975 [Blastocatellia bacterium]